MGAMGRLETILLTAFAIFSLSAFSWGRGSMMASQQKRLWGKGALLFCNAMDSGEMYDRHLMANAPEARAYATMLDGIGLMRPPLLRTAEIAQLNRKSANEHDIGFVDFITESGTSCAVVGWAILPKTGTRAHCVILSYDDPERGPIAFRVADEIGDRPDVAESLNNPAAEFSGWTSHFDRSILPPRELLLSAWAFDADNAVLYPLGTPKILHSAGTPETH
jgi:hypothetical protein